MLKYIENSCEDVYYNLALEEFVLNNFKEGSYLLLWKNETSIVLGKHQNIFEEINIKAVEDMGIKVARRISGGGTVFHDRGNLNYTFITDLDPNIGVDYDAFLNPVIAALETMGIHAQKGRICDIVINNKKISGSAQTTKKGRVLHHGTLLYDADLSMLEELLKPTEASIESKSTKSVRSTVTNIIEHLPDQTMTIDEFKGKLLKSLSPGGLQEVTLSAEQLQEIRNMAETKYSLWDWNYGKSPKFIVEKESEFFGEVVHVQLKVEKGMIVACNIRGDKLPAQAIEEAVLGCKYSYQGIAVKLAGLVDLAGLNNEKLAECFF